MMRDYRILLEKRHGWPRVRRGSRKLLYPAIGYIVDLGDTAAHPLLRKPEREIPATRDNVSRGLEEFQTVIECLRLPIGAS